MLSKCIADWSSVQRKLTSADESQEEFEGIMLPRHKQKRGMVSRSPSSAELPYERKVPKGRIPGAVDWRGSAADQHVVRPSSLQNMHVSC